MPPNERNVIIDDCFPHNCVGDASSHFYAHHLYFSKENIMVRAIVIIALFFLAVHWLTGGQQEIIDRTYDPSKNPTMRSNP